MLGYVSSIATLGLGALLIAWVIKSQSMVAFEKPRCPLCKERNVAFQGIVVSEGKGKVRYKCNSCDEEWVE